MHCVHPNSTMSYVLEESIYTKIFHFPCITKGSEKIGRNIWKYISNGQCCTEWDTYAFRAWWIQPVYYVRYSKLRICKRNAPCINQWNLRREFLLFFISYKKRNKIKS